MDTSPKFAEIKKEFEEAAKKKGSVKLAEVRKKASEEKAAEAAKNPGKKEEKKRKKRGELDEDSPVLQESTNIMADLIELQGA